MPHAAGAVVIVIFGVAKHDLMGTIPKFTEVALFAVDVCFNAFATCQFNSTRFASYPLIYV